MNNLTLTSKDSGDFQPHPEGIHPAVCVDVMDLGLLETEFQGLKKMVHKLKLVFESEQKTADGQACSVSRSFTASLHPKAKLAEFLGKWRGRPVLPGETIDLARLIGASCTLVISHQQNLAGKTYASIDAVSKPTRKVASSGRYDPVAARQRYADWLLRTATVKASAAPGDAAISNTQPPKPGVPAGNVSGRAPVPPHSSAGVARTGTSPAPDEAPYDPEVGF